MEEDDEKLKLIIGESRTRLEDTIITRGSHLFAKKDYLGSLACWKKIENMRVHSKDVRQEELDGATRCYYHLEQYDQAFVYAERLVSSAPNDSSAWNLHGLIRTKLVHPLSRQLESFLRSVTSPSPLYQVYLNIAEIYRHQNLPQIVKYLLWKISGHSRKSKLPSIYKAFETQLEILKAWTETSYTEQSNATSAFPEDTVIVELEMRFFGASLNRINAASLASSSTTDDDLADVRDPSRM
jgi:tetratricopeptide (TPR) repeat protein